MLKQEKIKVPTNCAYFFLLFYDETYDPQIALETNIAQHR